MLGMGSSETAARLRMRGWTRARARTACIGSSVVAIAVFVALHGANKLLFGDTRALSLDADLSVSSLGTVLLFVLAALAWWSFGEISAETGFLWPAVSVLCGLLALEGVLQLHQRLEDSLGAELNLLVIQPVLALAVLALFVACCRRLPVPERSLMAGAAITLALAQLASTANGSSELAYAAVVALQALEETLEMLTGALLLAVPVGMVLDPTGSEGRDAAAERTGDRIPGTD